MCACLNDCQTGSPSQTGSSSHHPCRRAFVGWVSSAWPWSSPLGGRCPCCCCPQGGSCVPGRTGWPGGAIWRSRTVLHLGREGGTGEELVTHTRSNIHTVVHTPTHIHTHTQTHFYDHRHNRTQTHTLVCTHSFFLHTGLLLFPVLCV